MSLVRIVKITMSNISQNCLFKLVKKPFKNLFTTYVGTGTGTVFDSSGINDTAEQMGRMHYYRCTVLLITENRGQKDHETHKNIASYLCKLSPKSKFSYILMFLCVELTILCCLICYTVSKFYYSLAVLTVLRLSYILIFVC